MLEDIRDCPGTMGLAASWVVVFALILLVVWQEPSTAWKVPTVEPLPQMTAATHRFGDLTWSEVRRGQFWRLESATFVHYSLLHLGMNVTSLIMLGRLIEPWYGAGPYLGVCLTIGGLGNLLGGLIRLGVAGLRPWVASTGVGKVWPGLFDRFAQGGLAGPVDVHTGGGSTILLGLLGLAAVVGWRSRTRIGGYLARQMVALLAFTAILGVVFSGLIDNYGHAGGAIVGAAIGLVHRPLLRVAERRTVRRASWLGVGLVLAATLVSAARADRSEAGYQRQVLGAVARFRVAEQVEQDLDRLAIDYGRSVQRAPWLQDPIQELDAWAVADLLARVPALGEAAKQDEAGRERAEIEAIATRLGPLTHAPIWGPAVADNLGRLRDLARNSLDDPPRFDQVYEFVACYREARQAIAADKLRQQEQLTALGLAVTSGR